MKSNIFEPGIVIEIVWFDITLIEVQVSAFNGYFAGLVNAYIDYDTLPQLVRVIGGFPASPDDVREFNLGGVHLRFLCLDKLGHAAIEIAMSTDNYRYKHLESATFQIQITPASIDEFIAELRNMSVEIGSIARLTTNVISSRPPFG